MVFHAMDGPLTSAAYHGHPGESYVRVAVIDYGGAAWTNPIYNEG